MNPQRRRWLLAPAWAALAGAGPPASAGRSDAPDDDDRIRPGRRLAFPRDHGAHPGARIEWWYATGWLRAARDRGDVFGFQITFFRSRTGLGEALPGRFAPRQLLFAHAAVTDLAGRRHLHAQRLLRWSGDETLPEARARRADTDLALGPWQLQRLAAPALAPPDPKAPGAAAPSGTGYRALLAAAEAGFALDLRLDPTQPLLLQGDAGYSRKGPQPGQASHYYSQPQLSLQARLSLGSQALALQGSGWLDHEWSDELLAPGATGWDWTGINLSDGGALTAFVLRRADGSVLWAGGSHRPVDGALRNFQPAEVVFEPLREWRSPATGARYPVAWRITTPAGRFELNALLDAQELDSRASTGTVYWEGLAELLAPGGARVGLGYLEMTGRLRALKLGF